MIQITLTKWLSGDFLQLSPVENAREIPKSLATPQDDTGKLYPNTEATDEKDHDRRRSQLSAVVQGLRLWQQIPNVVCLDVNIRAPGPLSTLLADGQTPSRNAAWPVRRPKTAPASRMQATATLTTTTRAA